MAVEEPGRFNRARAAASRNRATAVSKTVSPPINSVSPQAEASTAKQTMRQPVFITGGSRSSDVCGG